ncbi:MAG: hypothetical protein LBH19_04780 [Dysgonamonadaceae bacterium]|jgi:hypothetical protein|nr:hypothetical protein [Dysgonamonadaceae bacterium]
MQALKTAKAMIFLTVLSGVPVLLSAQHRLELKSSFPRPGDEIVKRQVSYRDPGPSGENVLWNFSRLEVRDEAYVLQYDSAGGVLTGGEHRTRYRYPVFETVRSRNIIDGRLEEYFATAFFYPPKKQYCLEANPENRKTAEAGKRKAGCQGHRKQIKFLWSV